MTGESVKKCDQGASPTPELRFYYSEIVCFITTLFYINTFYHCYYNGLLTMLAAGICKGG